MVVTCFGLIAHHLFAVWHGDRRLKERFGEAFDELKATTSVLPFQAVTMADSSWIGGNSYDQPKGASPLRWACSGGRTASSRPQRRWCATPHSKVSWAELPTLQPTC